MKKRLDFSTLPIGTPVSCAVYGNGFVYIIDNNEENTPVLVQFHDCRKKYSKDGGLAKLSKPTLRLGHDRWVIGQPVPDFDYKQEKK